MKRRIKQNKVFSINSKKGQDEKSYCIKCNKYRKFKKPKISYIFDKTLVVFIICGEFGSSYEKISKEEESIEILKNSWFN